MLNIVGNHEFKDSGADVLYYRNMWVGQSMLGKRSNSAQPSMWYSFDIGTVHIVGISTEVYCEDTSSILFFSIMTTLLLLADIAEQYAWLEKDLKTAYNRPDHPWIVVLGHRPLYRGTKSYFYTRLLRYGIISKSVCYLLFRVTVPRLCS